MATSILTAKRLRELLHYDPETGAFTWIKTKGRIRKGTPAGSPADHGYLTIYIDGNNYRCARLAWLYMTGEWPTNMVDHRNTNGIDDRFENLRDVVRVVNQQNIRVARSHNKLGVLGVSLKGGKFYSKITVSGKIIHLGHFDTAERAHEAYVEAKRKLHVGNTL